MAGSAPGSLSRSSREVAGGKRRPGAIESQVGGGKTSPLSRMAGSAPGSCPTCARARARPDRVCVGGDGAAVPRPDGRVPAGHTDTTTEAGTGRDRVCVSEAARSRLVRLFGSAPAPACAVPAAEPAARRGGDPELSNRTQTDARPRNSILTGLRRRLYVRPSTRLHRRLGGPLGRGARSL